MSLFNFLLLQASGDVDKVLEWMKYLQRRGFIDERFDLEKFREQLEHQAIMQPDGEGYSLTARGEQQIRKESLKLIFNNLKRGGFGQHRTPHTGDGGERLPETRPYRFGDPITQIDAFATINNAVKRGGVDEIQLGEQDFEVFDTEHTSSCATVLLIDLSHSMILYGEDRITPAKQVALALYELITTQFPKDSLHVAYFGDDARMIEVRDIPYLKVGPFHTNTKAGLQLAQTVLRNQKHPNHDHRRQALGDLRERPPVQEFLWVGSQDRQSDPGRGRRLQAPGHRDHHLHGHRRPLPGAVRGGTLPHQQRPRLLLVARQPGQLHLRRLRQKPPPQRPLRA